MARRAKLKRGLKSISIDGAWLKLTVPTTVGYESASCHCQALLTALSDIDLAKKDATRIANYWTKLFRNEARERGKVASGKFLQTTKAFGTVKSGSNNEEVIDVSRITTDYGDKVEFGIADATTTSIYSSFSDFHSWIKRKKKFMTKKGSWDTSNEDSGLNLSDAGDVKEFWDIWKRSIDKKKEKNIGNDIPSSRYVYDGIRFVKSKKDTDVSYPQTVRMDKGQTLLFNIDYQTSLFVKKVIALTPKRRKEIMQTLNRRIGIYAEYPELLKDEVGRTLARFSGKNLPKESKMYLNMVNSIYSALQEFKNATANNQQEIEAYSNEAYNTALLELDKSFNNIKRQISRNAKKKGLIVEAGSKKAIQHIHKKFILAEMEKVKTGKKYNPKTSITAMTKFIVIVSQKLSAELEKKL